MATILVSAILAICFIGAVSYVRKHGACQEECAKCGKICSHKEGPSLVERYRKDHPKTI
jgi:hypothetical protein